MSSEDDLGDDFSHATVRRDNRQGDQEHPASFVKRSIGKDHFQSSTSSAVSRSLSVPAELLGE